MEAVPFVQEKIEDMMVLTEPIDANSRNLSESDVRISVGTIVLCCCRNYARGGGEVGEL